MSILIATEQVILLGDLWNVFIQILQSACLFSNNSWPGLTSSLMALFSKMLVNVSIGFWTFSTRVPNKICLMLVWILLRMSNWFTPCLKDFFCSTLSISYNVWNVDLLLHPIQNHELILSILPIIKVFLKYSTIVWTHPLKNHVDVVIEYLNMRRWLVLNNLRKFLCSWLVDLAIILPTRTETVLKLNVSSASYALMASIHHHGRSISSGHYTCNVFYPDTAFLCNDNQILALNNFSQLSDSVYMVFYSRYVSGTSWV